MTQNDRILKALRIAGRRGITAYDFATIPPDGGCRIMRVAARINDLRAAGHPISSAGRRDGHTVYQLVSAPVIEAVPEPEPASGESLFEVPPTPRPHWQDAA